MVTLNNYLQIINQPCIVVSYPHALDANPLLIAKPPDDVRSAVTDRPRRVLEMDFGARDEAIGQELTEGGAFCDVAPRLCFLGVFWIARAGCKSPP